MPPTGTGKRAAPSKQKQAPTQATTPAKKSAGKSKPAPGSASKPSAAASADVVAPTTDEEAEVGTGDTVETVDAVGDDAYSSDSDTESIQEEENARVSRPPTRPVTVPSADLEEDDDFDDEILEEDDIDDDDASEATDDVPSIGSRPIYGSVGGRAGGRRPTVSVQMWDTLSRLVKEDKLKAVQHIFTVDLKKDDSSVRECDYVNRQDAVGNTLLAYARSPAMATFLGSFPGTNLELVNQQGASALWLHLDATKDKKSAASHRNVSRALVDCGANIFFRNILKQSTALELATNEVSKDFALQLRRLANAHANSVADPLLQGEARAYYRTIFDALDTDRDGVVNTSDIVRVWYAARNEQLFLQAQRNPQTIRPELVAQQLAAASPSKVQKEKEKSSKSSAKKGKGAPASPLSGQPAPPTEDEKLESFLAAWDINADGQFDFADFVRLILEFDRADSRENTLHSAIIDTPRDPLQATANLDPRARSTRATRRTRSRTHTGTSGSSRSRSRGGLPSASRVKHVASLMRDVDVFAMTSTQDLGMMHVVDDSAANTNRTGRESMRKSGGVGGTNSGHASAATSAAPSRAISAVASARMIRPSPRPALDHVHQIPSPTQPRADRRRASDHHEDNTSPMRLPRARGSSGLSVDLPSSTTPPIKSSLSPSTSFPSLPSLARKSSATPSTASGPTSPLPRSDSTPKLPSPTSPQAFAAATSTVSPTTAAATKKRSPSGLPQRLAAL